MTDFRGAVRDRVRVEAWDDRDPHAAYPQIYKDHLEEAFTACILYIRQYHPDAELRYSHSDMGGPIWVVDERD